MIRGRREREEVRKVRKEKGIRVRMAKGREREEWLRVGNREGKREGSGALHLTCQDGARHYSWRVKNLFCFCVKGYLFTV